MHSNCEAYSLSGIDRLVENRIRVDFGDERNQLSWRAVMIISKSVIIVQKRDPIVDHAWRIDITILLRQVFLCYCCYLFRFSPSPPLPSIHPPDKEPKSLVKGD